MPHVGVLIAVNKMRTKCGHYVDTRYIRPYKCLMNTASNTADMALEALLEMSRLQRAFYDRHGLPLPQVKKEKTNA